MAPKSSRTTVVGVGASAGGLEALTRLVSRLDPALPCALVVLQHLAPTHRSMMSEILARETRLPVREVRSGDRPRAGTIHVVPANCNALLRDGALELVEVPPEVVPKPSINQFFISLAAEEGDAAIGVVLSGTGSDGVAGLRAIQAAGGYTFAQAPQTAKYDGMPQSAIDAGVVDHVLAPEEIADRLPAALVPAQAPGDALPSALYERLLARMRERLRFDFSGYKTATLVRRLHRRQLASGAPTFADYVARVEREPRELELLARDVLISVTAFFRDPEAFEALAAAIGEMCARKAPRSEVRVWVAGCATGEEAYSVAMLLAEALDAHPGPGRAQVFATDVDDEALAVARRGLYPAAAMSEVPRELLERYFRPVGQHFEATKSLRDLIVFARHNLVSDPPFLRLDLVTCRNVLIYFDAPLQAKVLRAFHFGMLDEGCLFLGRSEGVTHAEQHFAPLERRERLFRKRPVAAGSATASASPRVLPAPVRRREPHTDLVLGALVRHFGAAAALCDGDGCVLHTVGPIGTYLHFPEGEARFSLADVAHPALRGELLTLLHGARTTRSPHRGRVHKLGVERCRVVVEPAGAAASDALVVLFLPAAAPRSSGRDAPGAERFEDELLAAREHLHALVEERATAAEELQALHEEAQASNEELQATNEELVGLNEELHVKTHELVALADEYRHLYDALQFPILVFDRDLRLLRYNAAASARYPLRLFAVAAPSEGPARAEGLAQLEALVREAHLRSDPLTRVVTTGDRIERLTVSPGLNRASEVATLVATVIDVTDLTSTQRALAESENRLSVLMEKTTVLYAMKDLQGRYLFANRRYAETLGLTAASPLGRTDFEVLPAELAASLWNLDVEAMRGHGSASGEHVHGQGPGRRVLHSTHQLLLDAAGAPAAVITEAEDVTHRHHAEAQLRITARVFDQAGEAIVVTDPAGIIQTVNAAFTAMTGFEAAEVVGQTTRVLKSGRHGAEYYAAMWHSLSERGYWQGEVWNRHKDGESYQEWATIHAVFDRHGGVEHYVAVYSDLANIKAAHRRAEYLATHDVLTGLPNRTLFNDHLRHALALARRGGGRVALLFVDLDDFKTINDTLGHDVGDALLVQAAQRLRGAVRDVDTVSRLGGDEFTIVLTDCDAEGAAHAARRIIDELGASFVVGDRKLFVTASLGAAFFPEDGEDSAELLRAADSAMYRAKELGRNGVEFFRPELRVRLLKRAALESALREALRLGRLRLAFQPTFAVAGGRGPVGAEALCRWTDPELGEVSPGEFIPIAEASGLIREVDAAVRDLLVAQLVRWREDGVPAPAVAFNVSPRSVREPEFAASLLAALERAGLPSDLVRVEITEGALVENSSAVVRNLDALHRAGVGIAVDDFGTGYSSLAYLKRLPLACLKIDKSFVDGLGQDHEDEAIVRAILGLARALDLETVAEGVEDPRQLAWLASHGCDVAQGYLFSRPVEAGAFTDFLREQGAAR